MEETIIQNNINGDNIQGYNVVVNKLNQCIDDINKIDSEQRKINDKIKDLETTVKKLNDCKTGYKKDTKNKYRQFDWFLWGILIILLGAILFFLIPVIQENYVGGILAFVGIIATFIVISNYMQVKEIKGKYSNTVKEIEDRYNNTVKDFNEKFVNIGNEIRNMQIGLSMSYAAINEENNPLTSLQYYLRAISLGMENVLEEKNNIQKCIEGIGDLKGFEINRQTVTLSDSKGKKQQYILKIDGILLDDIIYSIRLHKNYSIIKDAFEKIYNKKNNAEPRQPENN
ncbi:MAG: hypothetical protein LBF04_04240 [Prevotellaceae bacterium]|jgi:prefoldin subunit 5|nr:hypothetical protein [Prevotellaceae bacterium]